MRRLLSTALLVVASVGCAAAQTTTNTAASARRVAPDVHGEPLALLPRGAVAWVRVDVAAAHASPHYDRAMELATQLGAEFDTMRRELGFDPFQHASMAALALYLAPGRGAQAGWPVFYARGDIDRAQILAAARARNDGAAGTEGREGGIAYTAIGTRVYMFPAPDVVIAMERAMLRRVAERLTGEVEGSAADEPRFRALWQSAEGTEGVVRVAADLAAMRDQVRIDSREASQLDALVARAELSGEVTVVAVGEAHDAAGAQSVARTVQASARQAGSQLAVRLLGLSRLLNEGVQIEARDREVLLHVHATSDEARRAARIASVLRDVESGGSE